MQNYPSGSTQPTPVVKPEQWQGPQYPPRPETYYPPQTPPPPIQPPRKRMARGNKVALVFITTLLAALVLLVVVIEVQPGAQGTALTNQSATATSVASDGLTATAIANMNATEQVASTALSNDLTQTAMTPTPVPTTPVVSTGVGSAQSSGVWTITINSIKPTQAGPYDDAPKAGDMYILINFTAQNTGASAQEMSPTYFTLRDDQGNTYDLAYITVPSDPRGTVVGGQKLRGDLSYEIPGSLHSLTLQFDSPDDLDNSQVIQWNLTV